MKKSNISKTFKVNSNYICAFFPDWNLWRKQPISNSYFDPWFCLSISIVVAIVVSAFCKVLVSFPLIIPSSFYYQHCASCAVQKAISLSTQRDTLEKGIQHTNTCGQIFLTRFKKIHFTLGRMHYLPQLFIFKLHPTRALFLHLKIIILPKSLHVWGSLYKWYVQNSGVCTDNYSQVWYTISHSSHFHVGSYPFLQINIKQSPVLYLYFLKGYILCSFWHTPALSITLTLHLLFLITSSY